MEEQFSFCAHCDLAVLIKRQYVPIIRDGALNLTRAHSRKILSITCIDDPEQVCGSAMRIGYTGVNDKDKAIYRLKVRGKGRHFFTLPLLYIFDGGVFVAYEEESDSARREIECFRCKKMMYSCN